VATIGGLSAHAGQVTLLDYAEAVRETVKGIYLVHGDPKPAEILKGLLAERNIERVFYPEAHSEIEV
jgi:metallo-beta-lactamase family protein